MPKSIRDAIHGYIDLSDDEIRLTDTPVFQRLRGIKQLGLAYLVFPSAMHTRFEHSLGVRHVAQQMIESCNRSYEKHKESADVIHPEEAEVIKQVALLHDVGHPPLSHTLEKEVLLFPKHDSPATIKELISKGEIGDVLSEIGTLDQVEKILIAISEEDMSLLGTDLQPYMAQMVGNTICADLLDYARRDMWFTGIGEDYDETRLFRYFEVDDKTGQFFVRLADKDKLRRDVMSEIINVLRIRYSLSEKVIFHHAKAAAVSMLAKAVQYAEIKDASDFRSDFDFLTSLRQHENKVTKEIVSMLDRRRLFKPIFRVSSEEADAKDKKRLLVDELHTRPEKRLEVEREIESKCSLPEGTVAVYCPRGDMQLKEVKVNVLWRQNMLLPLDEVNHDPPLGDIKALRTRYPALWATYVFLHPDHLQKATAVERHFFRAYGLTNDLRDREPTKWEVYDRLDSFVEQFARESKLPFDEYEALKHAAFERSFSTRKPGAGQPTPLSYGDAKAFLEEVQKDIRKVGSQTPKQPKAVKNAEKQSGENSPQTKF